MHTRKSSLSLRLRSLGRSLPIAPNHHHAQEASDHSAAKEKEDDRDANGPDAGRKEGLDEVGVVDEGLFWLLVCVMAFPGPCLLLVAISEGFRSVGNGFRRSYHEKSPDSVVGEDSAGDNKHCEAYETVELVGVDC